MSYAHIEMEIVRQLEADRAFDGNIVDELAAMADYLEDMGYHAEDNNKQAIASLVGCFGISLIRIAGLLDVNFVECLEKAYEEDQENREAFEDDNS